MALYKVMIGCWILTIGLVSASPAYSDPITATVVITSGSMTVGEGQIGPAAFNLNGAGFSLIGRTVESLSLGPRICFPCEEGASISTAATATSPAEGTVTYLDQTRTLNPEADGLFLHFIGPTLTAPPVSPVAGTIITLTAPFTLIDGRVILYNQFGQTDFSADLSGRGLLELQLEAFHFPEISYWQYKGATYRFTGGSEPVPEPASLLLLATGLGEVARRRMRLRRA